MPHRFRLGFSTLSMRRPVTVKRVLWRDEDTPIFLHTIEYIT
jgi:hypothetical protein